MGAYEGRGDKGGIEFRIFNLMPLLSFATAGQSTGSVPSLSEISSFASGFSEENIGNADDTIFIAWDKIISKLFL